SRDLDPEAAAPTLVTTPAPAPDPTSSDGCSDLTLNRGSREVLVSGHEVDLTRTEFDLLAHLVRNPGVVVPREDLIRAVWASDFVPDSTHVVDVHLANLRRKLRGAAGGNQWIRTIRGVGFRFDPCCP
ncbi:MAG TPA: winged helix-turn-helix domain-containing protein, partial [Microlunatus sp.]|nr:winged helix-turn-helix domain-containing protein [Microlunatus sp.]